MKEIKVSVIIPVYNSEKYLAECLDSIINQTLSDIEIICVDDGSTDNSLQILREYAAIDARISILQQDNQYAGVARNNGLKIAKGEYVIFLDSDDFFDLTLLEKTYAQAKKENADIVLFGAKCFDTVTKEYIEKKHYFHRDFLPESSTFSRKDIPERIFTITTTCPWTKLFRREFIVEEKIEFQAIQHSNDIYFVLVALSVANRISYVDADLVFYRIGQTENLQSKRAKNPILFLKAYEAAYDEMQRKGVFEEVEKGFVATVVGGCAFNLDTIKDEEAKWTICREMMKPEFLKMGILDHPLEYYPIRSKIMQLRGMRYALEWNEKFKQNCKDQFFRKVIDNRKSGDVPLISVIIPVYNVAKYVGECLESIKKQTITEIEIICINDGSTDNSLEVLLECSEKDDRIAIYTQRNSGQSAARNRGIELARGKYLYFMDSDDLLDVSALQKLFNCAEEMDLDILYFDGTCFSDTEECREQVEIYKKYYSRKVNYNHIYSGIELMNLMLENEEYRVSPCLQLINHQFFIENELWFYEGIIHEDNLFNFKCMLKAMRTSHLQEKLFYRRFRPNSTMTKKVSFAHVYGYFCCYIKMLEFLKMANIPLEYKKAPLELLGRILHNARSKFCQLDEEEKYSALGLLPLMRTLFRLYISDFDSIKINLNNVKSKLEKTVNEKNGINNKFKLVNQEKEMYKNKIKKLEGKIKKLERKIKEIKESTTFKVGRIILWIPCKLKDCIFRHKK